MTAKTPLKFVKGRKGAKGSLVLSTAQVDCRCGEKIAEMEAAVAALSDAVIVLGAKVQEVEGELASFKGQRHGAVDLKLGLDRIAPVVVEQLAEQKRFDASVADALKRLKHRGIL